MADPVISLPANSKAYVGVGSNILPEMNISAALEFLSWEVTISGISTFYRTLPIQGPSGPPFLNGVLELRTSLAEGELTEVLARIESLLGRVRSEDRYTPRTIDLDLLLRVPLLQDDPAPAEGAHLGMATSHPHPDVLNRAFVAIPLFELAPELLLPPDRRPLWEVAQQFPDAGGEALPEFTEALRERFVSH